MEPSSPPPNRRRPSQPPASIAGEPDGFPPAIVDAADPSVRMQALRPAWTRERIVAAIRRTASIVSVVAALIGSGVAGRAAHRWLTATERFAARQITIEGTSHTRNDEVLAACGIHDGVNVLGIDAARAERAIVQLPWIAEAHVTRRLPGNVHIEVRERTPAALVSAGGLYLCTDDGTLFKRAQPGDPDDLPVISGIDRAEFERDPENAREYVRDALALLSDVDSSSLGGRVRVDEVHRDPTGDLAIVLAQSKTYVWLGRGPYRAKLARLSAILSELDRDHLVAAEVHLESDRHPERASVRLPVAQPPAADAPSAANPRRPRS